MRKQLGMGWGKGRPRMIKTIIPADELAYALALQQRWVDEHPDEGSALEHHMREHRRVRTQDIDTLKAENTELRKRMAKADLREGPRGDAS